MKQIIQLFHTFCVFGFNLYFWIIFSIIHLKNSFIPKQVVSPQKESEILNLSAKKLAQKIRNKELTSENVVKAFIERCKEVNPQINAIVEDRYETAIEEAKNVDKIIQSDSRTIHQLKKDSPLLGVPISVKGSVALEGMDYSVGAKLRKGIKATEDAESVAYLRRAGAIPIAITNTPELCCSAETNNDIAGYTCNPYDFRRSAGGSSGGEAALISSGASVLGVGSDFGGSIRYPCMFTGIFGHKPSHGVVSNNGHYPDFPHEGFQKMMTVGPISRYAEDLKLALSIMAGPEAKKLNLDTSVNLEELKIYHFSDEVYDIGKMPLAKDIRNAIQKAAQHFHNEHKCSVEQLNGSEMKNAHKMTFIQIHQIKNLKNLFYLKGIEKESNVVIEVFKAIINKSDYTFTFSIMRLIVEWFMEDSIDFEKEYASLRDNFQDKLNKILGENGVLLLPTCATSAYFRGESLTPRRFGDFIFTIIINVLGFPATQVPVGLDEEGLPYGFQVIAAHNQDRLCLAVAEELEKAFGGWIPPV